MGEEGTAGEESDVMNNEEEQVSSSGSYSLGWPAGGERQINLHG